MPAAAVIPAPIAYIKIVAVKKLVVGFLVWKFWLITSSGCAADASALSFVEKTPALHWVWGGIPINYFEKIRVFKAGILL